MDTDCTRYIHIRAQKNEIIEFFIVYIFILSYYTIPIIRLEIETLISCDNYVIYNNHYHYNMDTT